MVAVAGSPSSYFIKSPYSKNPLGYKWQLRRLLFYQLKKWCFGRRLAATVLRTLERGRTHQLIPAAYTSRRAQTIFWPSKTVKSSFFPLIVNILKIYFVGLNSTFFKQAIFFLCVYPSKAGRVCLVFFKCFSKHLRNRICFTVKL